MKYNLHNSNIFMGVSLSNRTFNRDFAKSFNVWVQKAEIKYALVVIFDECEVVNIKVFQDLPQTDAEQRSAFRTSEMKRMFQKFFASESIEVTTQSEYGKKLLNVSKLVESLRRAYSLKQLLYRDIQKQIKLNLSVKAETVGEEFIIDHLDALSEYIILELAWFYDFFAQDDKKRVEIYPGSELFTKRNLIQGRYESETNIPALMREPIYIDIKNLIAP